MVPAKEEEQPLLSTKDTKIDSEEEIAALEDEIKSFFENDKQIPKRSPNKKRSYSSCDVLTISGEYPLSVFLIKCNFELIYFFVRNT